MDLSLTLRLTLLTVIGAFVGWMLGILIAFSSDASTSGGVILRSLPALVMLVLMIRIVIGRTSDRPSLRPSVIVAAVVSYALFPPTWNGRALFGQLFVDPGIATVLIDAAVWIAVVVVIGFLTAPKPAEQERLPYQGV